MDAEKKLDRRQKRSKAAFRKAFEELLSEKPLNQVTVKEIAERADRDRKTFYLHYESIDDLIDEILEEEAERIAKLAPAVSFTSAEKLDITALFTVLNQELHKNFGERATVMKYVNTDSLIQKVEPILTRVTITHQKDLADKLGDYLEPFIACFCAGLVALYHEWDSKGQQLPLETLATYASATLAGGFRSLLEATEK